MLFGMDGRQTFAESLSSLPAERNGRETQRVDGSPCPCRRGSHSRRWFDAKGSNPRAAACVWRWMDGWWRNERTIVEGLGERVPGGSDAACIRSVSQAASMLGEALTWAGACGLHWRGWLFDVISGWLGGMVGICVERWARSAVAATMRYCNYQLTLGKLGPTVSWLNIKMSDWMTGTGHRSGQQHRTVGRHGRVLEEFWTTHFVCCVMRLSDCPWYNECR